MENLNEVILKSMIEYARNGDNKIDEQFFDKVKFVLADENVSGNNLEELFGVLPGIVRKDPELAKPAMEIVGIGLKHKNNYYGSIIKANSALSTMVVWNPETAENMVQICKKNANNSEYVPYLMAGILVDIAKEKPEMDKDISDIFKTMLSNENMIGCEVGIIVGAYLDVADKSVEMAKDAVDMTKIGLAHKNCSDTTRKRALKKMVDIVENNPNNLELAKAAMETIDVGLEHMNNVEDPCRDVYLANLYLASMQSNNSGTDECLVNIVEKHSLNNNHYHIDGLEWKLSSIACDKPELAERIVDIFAVRLSNKDEASSIYGALTDIVKNNPKMVKKAFETCKQGLRNNVSEFQKKEAKMCLATILDVSPEMAAEMNKEASKKTISLNGENKTAVMKQTFKELLASKKRR